MKRYSILNGFVDDVDMEKALDFVRDYIKDDNAPVGYVLAMNPEKFFALRKNQFLQEFFEKAALLIPDGIGIVWALRFLFKVKVSRVPGADLMQRICSEAPENGYRIFIYGASEQVNSSACEELKKRYPGILIVGRANGFVPQNEMDELVEKINQSNANILFIALGSPRQEEWMAKYAGQLTSVKLCQGIGGTLDTIVGTVKRAPVIWQKMGLEWCYRLLKQPRRIKRQLKLAIFVKEVFILKIKGCLY